MSPLTGLMIFIAAVSTKMTPLTGLERDGVWVV
jgi:hypothetical protein